MRSHFESQELIPVSKLGSALEDLALPMKSVPKQMTVLRTSMKNDRFFILYFIQKFLDLITQPRRIIQVF